MTDETATRSEGLVLAVYTRPIRIDGAERGMVRIRSGLRGWRSVLLIDGCEVASDWTPSVGPDAARPHRLLAPLDDGRRLSVHAGYVDWRTLAVAADLDGALIYESHPGKVIAPQHDKETPAGAPPASDASSIDLGRLQKNRVPIIVDIATGLLFFAVAKLTDLTTAAIVGAGVGVALLVIQRIVKVDLLGGLAMFGLVMLVISAGLAWFFKDEAFVKQRSTIIGIISAVLFLIDGAFGGRYLGERLSRYLVYTDIIPRRLSIGIGLTAITTAGLNWVFARFLPTDIWLLYTTFGDVTVTTIVFFFILGWARGGKSAFGP